MSVLTFLIEAIIISLSGVMAPGPLTAVTVGKGTESPHAGAFVAIGHGLIEFPLMIAVFHGFGYLINLPTAKEIIGVVGGLFLLLMGISMFRSMNRAKVRSNAHTKSPIVAGMFLSLCNPYFVIWWATIGAALVLRSASFGLIWFGIFAVLHWSCDFAWCYFLSMLSFKGKQFFGNQFQKAVFAVCGIFLIFLSGKFILGAIR